MLKNLKMAYPEDKKKDDGIYKVSSFSIKIGFDLALIVTKKKVCGQRKNFVINSFVNGRLIISTIKGTHSLHSFVL
jgi:hypothetical protein